MPFTASINISQVGSCDSFVVTDTSNYSVEAKNTFSNRYLIIYKSDGTVYRMTGQTTDQIPFTFGTYTTDKITITGIDKDYALRVQMVVVPNTAQSGSTYTANNTFALTCYSMQAFYDRAKKMAVNNRYERNDDYISDVHRILVEVEGAKAAAASGSDIGSAQLALDRIKKIIDNNKIPY